MLALVRNNKNLKIAQNQLMMATIIMMYSLQNETRESQICRDGCVVYDYCGLCV